jgi:hypothetical protein
MPGYSYVVSVEAVCADGMTRGQWEYWKYVSGQQHAEESFIWESSA